MPTVLFHIGSRPVYTYTVLMDAGLLLGLLMTWWLGRHRAAPAHELMDILSIALTGGLLGGRLLYVLLNLAYFSQHPLESLAIWRGGISFHGAVIGGGIALLIWSAAGRQPIWQWADLLCPALALGGAFGWLACLAGGCAYGEAGRGLLYLRAPDIYGVMARRFPTQWFGIGQSLLLLGIVFWAQSRRRAGLPTALYLIGCFGGQFVLEFWRGDEVPYLSALRLTQWLDLLLFLAGLALLVPWGKGRRPASSTDLSPPEEASPIS
ncbi:MAG: prolipoprotein diacylglyceryl transferase [Anaerolineae bacterium]